MIRGDATGTHILLLQALLTLMLDYQSKILLFQGVVVLWQIPGEVLLFDGFRVSL